MRNILLKSRKIWFTSVLAWRDELQQQHPMSETKNIQSCQYQYYKENLMIKVSHVISEMRKITLQIRLSMILMFHLTVWKTLHMILTPEAVYKVARFCMIFSQKTLL